MFEIFHWSKSSVPCPTPKAQCKPSKSDTFYHNLGLKAQKCIRHLFFPCRHLGYAQKWSHLRHTLQARYPVLLQPLVQGAGGTPVAGRGAALSHHQSCHMDPRGFKPLSTKVRDCEEPRPHIFLSSFPIVQQGPYTSATLKGLVSPLTHQATQCFGLSPYETLNTRPPLITANELFLSFPFFYPKQRLHIPLLCRYPGQPVPP